MKIVIAPSYPYNASVKQNWSNSELSNLKK